MNSINNESSVLGVLQAMNSVDLSSSTNTSINESISTKELDVLKSLNESSSPVAGVDINEDNPVSNVSVDPVSKSTIETDTSSDEIVKCPICGSYLCTSDISNSVCPNCNQEIDAFINITTDAPDGAQVLPTDPTTASPKITTTNESYKVAVASPLMECLNSLGLSEERASEILLESCKKIEECTDPDKLNESDMFFESTKRIVKDGKVVKVKVKSRKKKLSSAQKSALRKARTKAHTSSASKSRTKSMKLRSKKRL